MFHIIQTVTSPKQQPHSKLHKHLYMKKNSTLKTIPHGMYTDCISLSPIKWVHRLCSWTQFSSNSALLVWSQARGGRCRHPKDAWMMWLPHSAVLQYERTCQSKARISSCSIWSLRKWVWTVMQTTLFQEGHNSFSPRCSWDISKMFFELFFCQFQDVFFCQFPKCSLLKFLCFLFFPHYFY